MILNNKDTLYFSMKNNLKLMNKGYKAFLRNVILPQFRNHRILTELFAIFIMMTCFNADLYGKSKEVKTPSFETGTRTKSLLGRTSITIPLNYHAATPVERIYNGADFIIKLYARDFVQGNAAYCEFLSNEEESLPDTLKIKSFFEGKEIQLVRHSWGFGGIFAIPPDASPGYKDLEVRIDNEKSEIYRFPVKIEPVSFSVYRSTMNLGKYSDRDLLIKRPDIARRIKKETEKKNDVFSKITQVRISSALSHPRDHHRVTSSFYAKRIYDRYIIRNRKRIKKTPVNRYHYGLDLWGPAGAPIFAMADGVVVIAEDMFYEGKHTVIDHGNGIFTRYMHQSEFLVELGSVVKAGDLIGKSGATGMVTGPHLHVGLRIDGEYVDPESLLYLPVRD